MTQKFASPDDLECDLYVAGEDTVPVSVSVSSAKLQKDTKSDKTKRPELLTLQPSELSEYILSTFKRHKKNLSSIELEDLRMPSASFSAFKSSSSEELATNLKSLLPGHKKDLSYASEHLRVLVLSSSAIRATEIIRLFGGLRKQCGIGKCFAKHFKIDEQLKFFDTKRPSISVGTPNRLVKLFASGHEYFKFEDVKLVMIDTHRDQKQRNIFEIPETCVDLLDFYSETIRPALAAGKCKLVFF